MVIPLKHKWTATATCTARAGTITDTGAVVTAAQIITQVGYLAALCHDIAVATATVRWTPAGLDALIAGVDADDAKLPQQAYMAVRRLLWTTPPTAAVHVSDRVIRCGQESAGRALRSAAHRYQLTAAVLAAYPKLPSGYETSETRNRHRHVRKWAAVTGRLPVDLFEMEPVLALPTEVVLAAADRQLVQLTRVSETLAHLKVQLPLVAAPSSRQDWRWCTMPIALPPHLPADAELCTPTLRVAGGVVRVDLPWRKPVTTAAMTGHHIAIGGDWGVNTLLTATTVRTYQPAGEGPARILTDGRVMMFNAPGIAHKQLNLRVTRERLTTKEHRYLALIGDPEHPVPKLPGGYRPKKLTPAKKTAATATLVAVPVKTLPPAALIANRTRTHLWAKNNQPSHPERQTLQVRADRVVAQRDAVSTRSSNLNTSLGWAAARWLINQARAVGATAIYIEDLATLETRARPTHLAKGRRSNARNSGAIRSKTFNALHHLAPVAGIAVVTVPARGTSSQCPKCLSDVVHVMASDNLKSGWKWSTCACKLSLDRDHASSERIGSRGLAGQQYTRRNPKTNKLSIPIAVDVTVHRAKRVTNKTGPTRQQKTSVRLQRSTLPALTPATIAAVRQRPAGSSLKGPSIQVPGDGTHDYRPSQNSRTGNGFNRNVRSTTIIPYGIWGPTSVDTPPGDSGIPKAI